MVPHPDKQITFHAFGDGGALHRTGSHRLWVLNVTAAILWCLIDGRSNADRLAKDYGARFGIDDNTARQDVTTLLAQFRQWGLLNGGTPEKTRGAEIENPLEQIQVEKRLSEDISGLPRVALMLAGHCFVITFSNKAMATVWETLCGHLAAREQPDEFCTKLAILAQDAKAGKRFFCYENGISTEGGLAHNQVVPFLLYKLFEHRMAGLKDRLLFHAAVVARDGQALLLPAQSGAGKSTLSAALAASGWTYLSDELAVVDPVARRVEPFALPIGLKDKSMAALKAFIPDVLNLPRHIRMDHIGVRYLAAPRVLPEGRLPIKALVYPCYSNAAATQLTEIGPLDSLAVLAATGSSARPLISSDIQAMLQMASLPSYRLEFTDLGQAVKVLNALAM